MEQNKTSTLFIFYVLFVLDLIFYVLYVKVLLRYLYVVLKQLRLKMISPKTHEETLLHD